MTLQVRRGCDEVFSPLGKLVTEWFSAGYFTMTLQVRRGCDEVFWPLGKLVSLCMLGNFTCFVVF